ncbi:hypothetical protein C8J56DRAFT_1030692 [Mycena floridula]|nr:hypothetical protein C8J56DRAFT_1030692 [Mycena floridula]
MWPSPIFIVQHGRAICSEPFREPFCWSLGLTQSSSTASLGRISEFNGSMREDHRAFGRSRGMRWDSSVRNFADGNSEKTRQAKSNAFRSISHHAQFFDPYTDLSTPRSLTCIIFKLFGTKTLRPSNVKEEQHIWELWMSENIGSARVRTSGRIQIGPARKFWCFRLSFRAGSAVITRRISNCSFSLDFPRPECPILSENTIPR